MFWRCFAARGPGALFNIIEVMNKATYQDILADNLVDSARKLIIGRTDNDSKRTEIVKWKWYPCCAIAVSVSRLKPHEKPAVWTEEAGT